MAIFTKVEQARELALHLADSEDTDVTPEDVASMADHDLVEWVESWGFSWDGSGWENLEDIDYPEEPYVLPGAVWFE